MISLSRSIVLFCIFRCFCAMNNLRCFIVVAAALGVNLSGCSSLPFGRNSNEGNLRQHLGQPSIQLQQLFNDQRFPNIVVAMDGALLATWGAGGVTARRSEDGGKTWGAEIRIAESGIQGGGVTVDENTGDILAFVETKHPPAPIAVFRSADAGKTWQRQDAVIHPDSKGRMPSMHMNEHGITLRNGKYAGRLIRPSRHYAAGNRREEWPNHFTNAIYSDDGGRTWYTSEPFPENGTGEACVAELSDGTIYYNSRIHWDKRPNNTRRRRATSSDGGQTWGDWRIIEALPDGHQHRSYGCMGGLTRLAIQGRDILIFSNLDTPNAKREKITVWASFDGGDTWPVKRLVYDGPSGYSSMTSGRPGTITEGWIYLHFEGGPKGGSTLASFNLRWLMEGTSTGDGTVPQL